MDAALFIFPSMSPPSLLRQQRHEQSQENRNDNGNCNHVSRIASRLWTKSVEKKHFQVVKDDRAEHQVEEFHNQIGEALRPDTETGKSDPAQKTGHDGKQ